MVLDVLNDDVSVGLYCDGWVDKVTVPAKRKQSELLMPTVEEILLNNGLKLRDIKTVYLTNGPGSFTAIRLGLSFAKTLNIINRTEIRTISSFQAIIGNRSGVVALDARSGQSFIAKIENGIIVGEFKLAEKVESQICTENILENMMEVYDIATVSSDAKDVSAIYIKNANAKKLND